MIHLKYNPVGVDIEIKTLQEYLERKLSSWNIDIFGRVEEYGDKLMVFYKKNDYLPILKFNPKTNGRVFFLDSNDTSLKDGFYTTKLDIYFLLNVVKIKPDVTHRADEEIRMEILKVLEIKFNEIEIEKGQKVVSGFNTKLKDLQPYHFLKFTVSVSYQTKLKC